jgi:hypothetical protein
MGAAYATGTSCATGTGYATGAAYAMGVAYAMGAWEEKKRSSCLPTQAPLWTGRL